MDKRQIAIEYLLKLRDCKFGDFQEAFLGKDFGLGFVVAYLSFNKDTEITAKLLSEKMDVSMSRMTTLIQKLEERELVYREASKEDGRVSLLHLTKKGEEEGTKIIETSIYYAELIIDELGLEKIDEFLDTAMRIKNIVDSTTRGGIC